MLPIFQSLSRPEAIEQVLAQHIGTIVHIDFIVKMLYGELEPDAFKQIGFYTWNLDLINK